ncbi:MAG: hypothetical protein IT542_06455 [Rubellimicrobium sp.]|nr:hypothetical protein [Rubellimicrobium sp.]
MKRLLPLVLLPFLAACAEDFVLPPELGGPAAAPAPEGPQPVPPEVAPYLPPGVPGSLVMIDVNGCYVFSVEQTDPPSGFPVRDHNGNQICPAPQGAGA